MTNFSWIFVRMMFYCFMIINDQEMHRIINTCWHIASLGFEVITGFSQTTTFVFKGGGLFQIPFRCFSLKKTVDSELIVATETGSQWEGLNGRVWRQATSSQRRNNAVDSSHTKLLPPSTPPPYLSRVLWFSWWVMCTLLKLFFFLKCPFKHDFWKYPPNHTPLFCFMMTLIKLLLEEPWENEKWCLNVHLICWWGNKRAGRFMSGVCERWDQELTTIGCGVWFCWNDPGKEYKHERVGELRRKIHIPQYVISLSWKETVDRTNPHPLKLNVSLWRPSFELIMFLPQLYIIACFSRYFQIRAHQSFQIKNI